MTHHGPASGRLLRVLVVGLVTCIVIVVGTGVFNLALGLEDKDQWMFFGGAGILAVMLISVRERTREIGLRRAVGAKRTDIQAQFVLEAAMLGAAGGAAGVIVGLVAAGGVAIFGPWELVVSWRAALLGLGCSTLLALAVGAIPAMRAARLEPIMALRAE